MQQSLIVKMLLKFCDRDHSKPQIVYSEKEVGNQLFEILLGLKQRMDDHLLSSISTPSKSTNFSTTQDRKATVRPLTTRFMVSLGCFDG
jgi:hypothetical protein